VEGTSIGDLVTFPDSRGELVIRCSLEDVKDAVQVGTATFKVSIVAGEDVYAVEDTIPVISCPE
jgi:hypothetical protein